MEREKSPILRSISANRRPSQFLDVTPVNEGDIAEILHGDANLAEVTSFLRDCGFSQDCKDDPRLISLYSDLLRTDRGRMNQFNCFELTDLKRNHLLLQKALNGDLAISEFKAFTDIVTRIYSQCKSVDEGSVASYIPQLAEVDPDLFGVSVCSVDGQRFNIGETQKIFSVQSVSKVFSYAAAVETNGLEFVHRHVGMEPSGRNFNERVVLPSGIPHNPLINMGAIMVTSLLYQKDPRWKRFEKVSEFWQRLTGSQAAPAVLQSTFLAERETANRNFGLAHMMAEKGDIFPQDLKSIQTVLDEYFSYCSLGVTTEAMAQAAATLANGGLNPISDDRIFSNDTVTAVLSTMMTCGMYDASGEFSAAVGFPAKSGVSGLIMAVIPGVCGICTFSPRIDSLGNSVRGLRFFSELAKQAVSTPLYNIPVTLSTSFGNQFEWKTSGDDWVLTKFTLREFSSLWWAASVGDKTRIRQLAARGIDVNEANYSNRTALNFAISNGHMSTVKLLVQLGANLTEPELFQSYLQDARRVKRQDMMEFLTVSRRSGDIGDSWTDSVEEPLLRSRIPVYRYFAGEESVSSLSGALEDCGIEDNGLVDGRVTKIGIRALCGKLIVPNWSSFVGNLRYAIADSDLEVAVCTNDKQRWRSGSSDSVVALDGIARVLLYELALDEIGVDELHKVIGREPSGQRENTLRLNADLIPYNALTMSGCLTVCCKLLNRGLSVSDVLDRLKSRIPFAESVDGVRPPVVHEGKYMDMVRCTLYWLSANEIVPSGMEEVVDLFKKCHETAVSLSSLAEYAQSLATSYSPLLSLLYTSGLDEQSGEFSFRFGLPARTSLSGVVMGVVPGVLGYVVRDPCSNATVLPASVKQFQTRFAERVNFHMFKRHTSGFTPGNDPTLYFGSNDSYHITKFLSSAFHGDLSTMKHLVAEGLDVNAKDMDGRTALHIAKGVGNYMIGDWLKAKGADETVKDVWGMTPDFDENE
jgi:glutaminase